MTVDYCTISPIMSLPYYTIIPLSYDLYTTVIFTACISACAFFPCCYRSSYSCYDFHSSPMDVVLAHKPNPYHHDCDCTKLFTICKKRYAVFEKPSHMMLCGRYTLMSVAAVL